MKEAKKTKLAAVDPTTAAPSKPKILIFGKPGVKKTWTSLDFPSTYYIDTEGGANNPAYTDKLKKSGGAYLGPDQGSTEFSTIIDQVKALATEPHKYRTLVIDSITKVFNNEIADEAERLGDKNNFGADKKPAVSYMRQLVNWLTRLDMNVILIAHEKIQWGIDSKGIRTEVGSTFDGWDKLEYELDLCLQIVRTGENSIARIKKSRLAGFVNAESFPWTYDAFAERHGKDVMEKQAVQIKLATPEQLDTIKKLLDKWKIPEGQEAKWFKAANVSSYEEMDEDKIGKLIFYIKQQLNGE